jgi:hypothetical protein
MSTTAWWAICRIAAAATCGLSGYLHAQLYVHGYRVIPYIGPMFLLQAAGALAVAVLMLATDSPILRLGAAGLAGGALVGFILSRTTGVLGFIEHGLDPAPQALLSVLAETTTLVLLATPLLAHLPGRVRAQPLDAR